MLHAQGGMGDLLSCISVAQISWVVVQQHLFNPCDGEGWAIFLRHFHGPARILEGVRRNAASNAQGKNTTLFPIGNFGQQKDINQEVDQPTALSQKRMPSQAFRKRPVLIGQAFPASKIIG